MGWCGFRTPNPETEVAKDCDYPDEGFLVTTDESGRFRIEGYPLPDLPFDFSTGPRCEAAGARCGLAWFPGGASLPVFVTLFDLRG